jgi:hypothetical protein
MPVFGFCPHSYDSLHRELHVIIYIDIITAIPITLSPHHRRLHRHRVQFQLHRRRQVSFICIGGWGLLFLMLLPSDGALICGAS